MPTRPSNPELADPFDIQEVGDMRIQASQGSADARRILALDKHDRRRHEARRKKPSGAARRRFRNILNRALRTHL